MDKLLVSSALSHTNIVMVKSFVSYIHYFMIRLILFRTLLTIL